MTTGQRIRAARKNAGLTQKELGEKLGVAYQTLAQWENDLRNPKYETLQRIAAALEVSASDLMGESVKIINVPMPEYPLPMPTKEQLDKMSETEREYYYLRLLADIAPDELRKKHIENYDKLNKLGMVEIVRRGAELARLTQYTAPDQRWKLQDSPVVPSEEKENNTSAPPDTSKPPLEGE